MSKKRKKTAGLPKGPTRAQLKARIAKLEGDLDRLKKGDRVRREGEHWYELIELFNPAEIRRVPYAGSNAYLMGMLQDAIVVEVPEGSDYSAMMQFTAQLRKAGLSAPPIFIYPGVRFLKIATIPPEMEAKLDAAGILEEPDEEDPDERGTEGVDAAGAGPEPSGDGLGRPRLAVVAPGSNGRDSHEEPERAGEDGTSADGGGG